MLALADCADLCVSQIFKERRRSVSARSGYFAEMAGGPTRERIVQNLYRYTLYDRSIVVNKARRIPAVSGRGLPGKYYVRTKSYEIDEELLCKAGMRNGA